MTSYGKLFRVLSERPLAYDDETDNLIGTVDIPTNTKWGKLPPVNIKIPQLVKWVDKQIEDGVLIGDLIGEGATRRVDFNDGKTIFKYNYSTNLGNQSRDEIETYYDIKNEWSDCVPKIFNHGENWSVQEMAEKFDTEYIKTVLGVKKPFELLALNSSLQFLSKAIAHEEIDYDTLYKNKMYQKAKQYVEQETGRYFYTEALHEMIWNPKFKRLYDFANENRFMYDFRIPNLGVINGKPVMVDYGYGDR